MLFWRANGIMVLIKASRWRIPCKNYKERGLFAKGMVRKHNVRSIHTKPRGFSGIIQTYPSGLSARFYFSKWRRCDDSHPRTTAILRIEKDLWTLLGNMTFETKNAYFYELISTSEFDYDKLCLFYVLIWTTFVRERRNASREALVTRLCFVVFYNFHDLFENFPVIGSRYESWSSSFYNSSGILQRRIFEIKGIGVKSYLYCSLKQSFEMDFGTRNSKLKSV